MSDVGELRQTLLFEEIAARLTEGHGSRKTARDLDIRPEAFREILDSDEFLVVLREHDGDLADDIIAERNAAKPLEYEVLILAEAVKSVECLRDLRDFSGDDKIVIGACTALVSVAEKVKKIHTEKTTKRVVFSKNQLETLVIAAQEVDALEQYAEPSPGGIDSPADDNGNHPPHPPV